MATGENIKNEGLWENEKGERKTEENHIINGVIKSKICPIRRKFILRGIKMKLKTGGEGKRTIYTPALF